MELIRHVDDAVIVGLVLADGSPTTAILDRVEADWLELRPGQIVPVTESASEPGFLVVGQRVDVAG